MNRSASRPSSSSSHNEASPSKISDATEKLIKQVANPNKKVLMSPMASALLKQKKGIYIPPTNIATPSSQTSVLSPACTKALQNHLNLNGAVNIPHDAMPYRYVQMGATSFLNENELPPSILRKKMGLPPLDDSSPSNIAASPISSAVTVVTNSASNVIVNDYSTTSTSTPSSYNGSRGFGKKMKKIPFYPAMHNPLVATNIKDVDHAKLTKALYDAPKFVPRSPLVRTHKRALIIGVTYIHNVFQKHLPVHKISTDMWFSLLTSKLGYLTREVRILCDTPIRSLGDAVRIEPTDKNIRDGLEWLVSGAKICKQLFLAYSGMVTRRKHRETKEKNKLLTLSNYELVPSDFPIEQGAVRDEDLHGMIRKLPKKANLVIFLDCRMSWNVVRLPYIYLPFKNGKNSKFQLCQPLAPESWDTPPLVKMTRDIISKPMHSLDDVEHKKLERQRNYFEENKQSFEGSANVICFAASAVRYHFPRYNIFGVNWIGKGDYTDASCYIFERYWKKGRLPTARELIFDVAEEFSPPGVHFQVPQVCCTREFDLDEELCL